MRLNSIKETGDDTMTAHLSARIAWHMDGWNGHICQNPVRNTYCVGPYSYPGEMVKERRDIEWECEKAGRPCSEIDTSPPCIYGVNAFGKDELEAFADPPEFFHDETQTRRWPLPPATVCLWPYEEMYRDEVIQGRGYDNDERRKRANDFFSKFAKDKSLIFYYSNYSNPFSEDDQKQYVITGIARLKEIGKELLFTNCSEETKRRFGGGFVWDRNVTSHYPEQGLRIPYHLYLDKPEVIQRILFTPDNPRNFKYGTREFDDDEALGMVERCLEICAYLKEIPDTSEDWGVRIAWLQSLMTELWSNRGLYPGLPMILDLIGFQDAIPCFKKRAEAGKEKEIKEQIFAFLDSKVSSISGLNISGDTRKGVLRQWKLREDDERLLLTTILPRFALSVDQLERILSTERSNYNLYASLTDIGENPYILSEQFVGDGPDDSISFSKIDNGVFPSPDLGESFLAEKDDAKRLRGLCVDRLNRETKHAFMTASQVIHDINNRLSYLPEWKRHQFKERYLTVDEEVMQGALAIREEQKHLYLYLKTVFEDERKIESEIRTLANRPDIKFKTPMTEKHWHTFLYDSSSSIAKKNPAEYEKAIAGQVQACRKVFVRPICVISGEAGSGKTTIIKAIIQAVEKVHGAGASFQLLAPTGKAADRIREKTGKKALTIHSFLAKRERGWLNDNLTFKRMGGTAEEGISTYIIDEASMLDIGLAAALFRAINWTTVQRLIFVGDPNQLPPIGRGRVFADIIDWLEANSPESVAVLGTNIRQMENRICNCGTGILDLAELFIRAKKSEKKDSATKIKAEELLRRVQEGGDVDKDLHVLYWNGPEDLNNKLIQTLIRDMECDTGIKFNQERPFDLWGAAFSDDDKHKRPEQLQVISPYRGEPFGTDNLNAFIQQKANGNMLDKIGHLGGITLFDKVLQYRNRWKHSDPLYAYNVQTQQVEPVDIFNGEIGFVKAHGFDGNKWKSFGFFKFEHLQVVFSRKENLWVGYGSQLGKNHQNKWINQEKPQDNLELAYAISVHKAQGSEFKTVYLIVPKHKKTLLSTELFYTALTRAQSHCTLLIEEDVSPIHRMRRLESSHLLAVNSSLFEFRPIPDAMLNIGQWYEEGKIHRALADIMVRSKSEVIIANLLFDREVPFKYEMPLYATDGTFYLPDFTITYNGEQWYWEHIGMLDDEEYRNHWETKKVWYESNFPGKLLTTKESRNLSHDALKIIQKHFSVNSGSGLHL